MKTIGERIKNKRTKKGLSLDGLSKLSNVSKTYLSEIESGIKSNPSADILLKIAYALEVSLSYLIEGKQEAEKKESLIPETLKEAAIEHDWKFSQVLQLFETKNLAISHRGQKIEGGQVTKEGWIRLFNILYEQRLI